jgi:hypothetical protein
MNIGVLRSDWTWLRRSTPPSFEERLADQVSAKIGSWPILALERARRR